MAHELGAVHVVPQQRRHVELAQDLCPHSHNDDGIFSMSDMAAGTEGRGGCKNGFKL